jgi:hypothetical protein
MGQCKQHLTEKAKLATESRPRKKVQILSEGSRAIPNTSSTTTTHKRKVSIEEVDDKDDLRQSPSPRNPKHIIKDPNNDVEVIEVHSDVPQKPAESAEAELSELTRMKLFNNNTYFFYRVPLQKMDFSRFRLLLPPASN